MNRWSACSRYLNSFENCGINCVMKRATNTIPIVKTFGAWQATQRGYSARIPSSPLRKSILFTIGILTAAAIDYRLFNGELLATVTRYFN